MELVWIQLLNVLSRLVTQSQALTVLAKRLREAILHEQVREIGELVMEQEEEMQIFQDLEREREALLHAIGQGLDQEPNVLIAARLLQHVPLNLKPDYEQKLAQLRRSMHEVKQEQEVNQRLLRRSQQFMHWLVQYLVTPEGATPVYDASGANAQRSYYHIVNQAL